MILAKRTLEPNRRCVICGIPLWWLRLMHSWPNGGPEVNRRFTVDHIDPNGPSVRKNTRILCFSCNNIRGKAEKSDATVLAIVGQWYEDNFSLKVLWWLRTSPGKGGSLYKTVYLRRRDEKLRRAA